MSSLENLLTKISRQPLGTIVHIGAGSGSCLEIYAGLQYAHLHLVEGDRESAEDLSALVLGRSDVSVHAVAVAPEVGRLDWHRYNMRALNGPLSAQPLQASFPRLRHLGTDSVMAQSVLELIASFKPARGQSTNLLVLDLPGQEVPLLQALGDPQALGFEHVIVRTAGEGGYAAVGGAAPLVEGMAQHHFSACEIESDSDPLWPAVWLKFDARAAAEATRAADLAGARNRNEQLKCELAAVEERCKVAERAREQSAHSLSELASQVMVLRRETESLKSQLDQLIQDKEALKSAQAIATRLAEDRAAQVEALTTARDDQTRLASDLAVQLEQASHAKCAAEKTVQETRPQLEALSKNRDELVKELEKAYQQANESRDGMVLAVRLQTLRENDLTELQKRYAEVYRTQRTQHDLLTKLAERLAVANEYFQLLPQHELLDLVEAETKATAAPLSPPRAKAKKASKSSTKSRRLSTQRATREEAQPEVTPGSQR